MESYMPKLLPEAYGELNYTFFMDELIDATVAFEVYVEKLKDSKVDSSVFLPTLSQKEALPRRRHLGLLLRRRLADHGAESAHEFLPQCLRGGSVSHPL